MLRGIYRCRAVGITLLNACTTAHLNTIPSPAPSAKLRVLVLPITGDPPYAHTNMWDIGNTS